MAQTRLTVVSGKTPTITITNGFAVRDDLKARGYKFDGATGAWTRTFDGPKEAFAEIVRGADAGFEIWPPEVNVAKVRAMVAA